ncbi:MAG: pilus assembly protein TadG-related protein [Burkholderiaceae bacterium]
MAGAMTHAPATMRWQVGARQRGAALVLALGCLFVAGAALYLVYDIGTAVAAKTRLSNAADSAAYSAAQWRARALNFVAYSNRAIIAQEVAIAQALTRQSWAAYFENVTNNIATVAQVFPPAYAIAEGVHEVAMLTQYATDIAAQAEILLRDSPQIGYKSLLVRSQRLIRTAGGTFGAGAVAMEVVKAADPNMAAFALSDGGAFQRFSRVYESDTDRLRLAGLTTRSLDDYTRDRGHGHVLPLPGACLPIGAPPSEGLAEYRKRGGTGLVPGLERWEAADTGSLHNSVRTRFSRRCQRREILPLGWGGAEAAAPDPIGGLRGNTGAVRDNPIAYDMADSDLADSDARQHQGTGIARVLELDDRVLDGRDTPRSRVAVLASLSANRLRGSAGLGLGASSLTSAGNWPGGRLWALSAAETYFRRPPTATGRAFELASLYSPYWQARLVPVTTADRDAAGSYGAQ